MPRKSKTEPLATFYSNDYQYEIGIDEVGRTTLPNGDLVWMYAFTSSASSASLMSQLETENSGTDAPHIRIANWSGLS